MKRLAFLLIVLCVATPLHAEDADIQRALAHSPEVAIAQARVQEAEDALRAAKRGWFHPQVSVYAGESAFTGATRAGIQVSQDIDRLLTLNRDEVRQAAHRLTMAQQELLRAQQTVIRQLSEAHLRVRTLARVVAIKTQTATAREQVVTLTRTQFTAGAIPLERLLAAQQSLADVQQALWQAQSELQQARVVLAQWLGEPLPPEENGTWYHFQLP